MTDIGTHQTTIGWAMQSGPAWSLKRVLGERKVIDRLATAFLAAAFLFMAAYAWLRPDYNWDMVAYVATALENRYSDPVELHEHTWAVIDERTSEAQQYTLKQGNAYNLDQWQNPQDFQSQLSMYRVKVGYVALLRLLEPVVGLTKGAMLLSILPALGLGVLLIAWLGRAGAVQAGFLLLPLLVVADLFHMTTGVTPDMLLSAVALLGVYLLYRRMDWTACIVLFASVLIRPDNLITTFAVLIAAIAFSWRVLPFLVTFAASFVACMVIAKVEHHPGWWTHFYFSNIQLQNSMTDFHPAFGVVDMVRGYVRGLVVALSINDWPALYGALLAGWALLARAGRLGEGRENALMFAMAIGLAGKFASFPLPDDRFYFVYTAGMAIMLALMWKPRFDSARPLAA